MDMRRRVDVNATTPRALRRRTMVMGVGFGLLIV